MDVAKEPLSLAEGDRGLRRLDGVIAPAIAAQLCARLARLLLAYGADADFALRQVDRLARALGRPVHVQLGDGAVLVTAGETSHFGTRVSRALPAMAVDMTRLAAIEAALAAIEAEPGTTAALGETLDAIETRTPVRPGWTLVLGVAITAAALARLFGASWPIVAVAFLAGLIGTALRRRLADAGINPIGSAFAVAFASGLVAALATKTLPGQSAVLALSAAGMVLVPGVPLINGVRDLVGGHAGLAVVRLTLASATVLAIGFALFLAAGVAGDSLPVGEAPGRLPVPEDIVFSAAAVIGYTMLFDVPMLALPAAMLCGVLSHSTRTALAGAGVDLVAGSLIGAIVAGLAARVAARAYRAPAVTFAFPGTVAMIPGSYGFRAGIGGLHLMALGPAAPASLVADTLSLAITTAMMTAAIGIGLSLAFAVPLPRPPAKGR